VDWRAIGNLTVSTLAAGVTAGVVSWQTTPIAPWQVHAGAAVTGALLYLTGHLRQSPLPEKK